MIWYTRKNYLEPRGTRLEWAEHSFAIYGVQLYVVDLGYPKTDSGVLSVVIAPKEKWHGVGCVT
ncbi:hypothetical protein N7450_005423 [Penicillium hetheringtonii]|uniref:Uncharacterized protein n=1 Tax=Penicillium hetheringtonii TaxID=911720 RepID=A0AAD6GT25_9EURO|nr:hypothetical protein N7450_005423 [Penicillium hetheringtonii]